VPSHAFREVLEALGPRLSPDARVAWATKGLEPGTALPLHRVAEQVLGGGHPAAVVSGPTFAREVARELPTAVMVAATDPAFARDLAGRLHSGFFRVYVGDDLMGVEVGGAVKNVLAIAAGIADGLGFGANTRAALITRGLAEMTRLGTAAGGRAETFMGLAGLGDLVLTCTDDLSRNRRYGLALARGESPREAEAGIGQVVEGVTTARVVLKMAARHRVEMPITEHVNRVIYDGLGPAEAVQSLLGRADVRGE
jgi:glycerol-3-phosphate dehydrogenase (NAD(P)+)